MTTVLWTLAGGALLLYLGAPLIVRRQFWVAPEPGPRLVRSSELDQDVAQLLDERGAALEAAGLEHTADLLVPGWLPNVTTASRYFVDVTRRIVGVANVVIAERGDDRQLHTITAIGSRRMHPDGTWSDVTTTDSDEPNPMQAATDVVIRIPGASAEALLTSHLRSLEEHASGVVLGRAKTPVDIAREDLARTVEVGMATGLLDPHPSDRGRYRLTVRGAYATTWRNLPPLLGITRRRHLREGQARLASIGWSQPSG